MSEILTRNLAVFRTEAIRHAVHLQRRLALPLADREDLSQDLLLDLFQRVTSYDFKRGPLGPFVGTIVRNRGRRIARRVQQDRRQHGGHPLPLDASIGKDCRPLTEIISLGQSLWDDPGAASRSVDLSDERLAAGSAVACLSPDDRDLCRALAQHSVTELTRVGRGSRSDLYRRIAKIRRELLAYGLSCAGHPAPHRNGGAQ